MHLNETITFITNDNNNVHYPSELSIKLKEKDVVRICVNGFCASEDVEQIFEFDTRNMWKRSSAGISSRLGIDKGIQTSLVKTKNIKSGKYPEVSFDDSSSTHKTGVSFIGNEEKLIWIVTYTIQKGT